MLINAPAYTGGLTLVLMCGCYGTSRMVFMDFDPLKTLEMVEREKIELLSLVPTMIHLLINAGKDKRYDLSSLKRINYGAMPIDISLLKTAKEFFKCELVQFYGMTENTGGNLTRLEPFDHVTEGPPIKLARLASAGRPVQGVDLRIFDQEDRELPRGETGEIVFKSISLMDGYWNMPEQTERVMQGGWYHTGDMGYMDDEGYLFIVDGKNYMVLSGGFNVYPSEVETILLQHEDIREAVVLGVPDAKWGEKVVAVVCVKEGKTVSEEEIQTFCRKHLAGYKIPKEVISTKHPLPKNHFGKILRNDIKKIYRQRHETKK